MDGAALGRLRAAAEAIERLMLERLEPALGDPRAEVRRRACALLAGWRSFATMELLYSKASKYDVPAEDVDCVTGMQKGCMVFCCRKVFARMTEEDLRDGLEMDPGLPWFLRVTPEGCYALDQKTGRCTVWEKRPMVCRLYNCYKARNGPWGRKGR